MRHSWLALVVAGVACSTPQPASLPSSSPARGTTAQLPAAAAVPVTSTGNTDIGLAAGLPSGAGYIADADRVPARFPSTWKHAAGRSPVFGAHAMVASDAPLASQVGVEILKRGGNAVDAAVAMAFTLAVVYPEAGNLGGGGYMLIHLANGRSMALDYREIAPVAATRNMYLDSTGRLTENSIEGPLASGVPGAVAGLTEALAKYGTLPLAEVLAPAIRHAENGFRVDSALAYSLHSNADLIARFGGKSLFMGSSADSGLKVGAVLKQPALASLLRGIAANGRKGFYAGRIADTWTKELRDAGGLITTEDLANYEAVWREPLRTTYRGFTLLTMPPSSSGGITVTESLNILEGFGPLPAFGSTRWAHLLGSAYQRAFIDRNAKLADPAFAAVPVEELIDKGYARRLRNTIGERASSTASLTPPLREGSQTTHLSVVDALGNSVASTTTLNNLYGSGVYLKSIGIFLNDEMDDFAAKPGTGNMFGLVQGEANAIQPGKRPLSAMSPTIVLDAGGKMLLSVGSRGGPRIITSVSQVIMNVIDYHMTLADAMSAPRLHHQALPDTLQIETGGVTRAVLDSLRALGYGVRERGGVGQVNAVMRVKNGFEGVSDPRGSGRPVGY